MVPEANPLSGAGYSGRFNALKGSLFTLSMIRERDGTVRLWDARTGQFLNSLQGHTGVVYGVALSTDGHLLASGGVDGTVRLWESESGRLSIPPEVSAWRLLRGRRARLRVPRGSVSCR